MSEAALPDVVFDVIKRRRVSRSYLPEPVDDALLAKTAWPERGQAEAA